MLQIVGLNTLDLLLIFLVFIGLLIGFFRGVGPQLQSLASIWFGLLLALWLYRPFSNRILQGLELTKVVSDTLAFLLMLFVSYHAIRLIVRYLTKPPEQKVTPIKKKGRVGPVEPPKPSALKRLVVGPVGTILSMILGVVLAIVWIAIFMGVAQFFFQTGAFSASGVNQPGLTSQIQSSTLVPYFNRVLYVIVQSLSLFVLDEGPNILESVVNNVVPPAGG
ncbi:MAG TPA: CvpA family protein [Anaerolineae bacterium]|nr:CvpA family protein [Anaerolineae bacterium]MCB0225470.1 CvpA family protein [Anaerolineae bacterium]MCB9104540.1 CvpA family protein [Anaerolineales bacterium]HRV93389.1 CvpA family protein [Anaerolineae bacterium]